MHAGQPAVAPTTTSSQDTLRMKKTTRFILKLCTRISDSNAAVSFFAFSYKCLATCFGAQKASSIIGKMINILFVGFHLVGLQINLHYYCLAIRIRQRISPFPDKPQKKAEPLGTSLKIGLVGEVSTGRILPMYALSCLPETMQLYIFDLAYAGKHGEMQPHSNITVQQYDLPGDSNKNYINDVTDDEDYVCAINTLAEAINAADLDILIIGMAFYDEKSDLLHGITTPRILHYMSGEQLLCSDKVNYSLCTRNDYTYIQDGEYICNRF